MADHRPLIPVFLKKEGGLSRAKTDTASRNPAPCRITKNGKSHSDYHTNKGVTWTTFKQLAGPLGYSADCATFAAMPASVWGKIFKRGYWDPWGLDKSRHPAMAYVLVWWSWGSGLGGAMSLVKKFLRKHGVEVSTRAQARIALDELADRQGVEKTFMQLRDIRLAFYRGLSSAPANYKGWKASYDRFTSWAKDSGYLSGSAGGAAGIIGIVAFGFISYQIFSRLWPK